MFDRKPRQKSTNCGRWVFLHIPKCAGQWIKKVTPELNKSLGSEVFSGINLHFFYRYDQGCGLDGGINYGELKKMFKKNKLGDTYTFTSIRDPFQWYISFYIWSHSVGRKAFIETGFVPHYDTFEKFILDNKVTFIGAVRPHLNACNSYVRASSLKDDLLYLVEKTFPGKSGSIDSAIFEEKPYNSLKNVSNEERRKVLDESELKAKFRAYIENGETDCFYTEEMKDLILERDNLVFRLLEQEHPVVMLDQKLSGLLSEGTVLS